MLNKNVQCACVLFVATVWLSACGGAAIKSDTGSVDSNNTTSGGTKTNTADNQESKKSGLSYGQIKKRKIPYRPNPTPVTNKAFADKACCSIAFSSIVGGRRLSPRYMG